MKDSNLYGVAIPDTGFSIAAHARTLKRLGSIGSGFCFNNHICFLLASDEDEQAITDFCATEFGLIPVVTQLGIKVVEGEK